MTELKKNLFMKKIKKSSSDKTQQLKLWQKSKTQLVKKLKKFSFYKLKTQILTKLKKKN